MATDRTSKDSAATGRNAARGRGDLFSESCPTRHLLDRIATKWMVMAVKVLADAAPGEVRFSELRRRMPGVSQKMLSQTLRNLVLDGLAARRVHDSVPPQVHYRLTDLGRSLDEPLTALRLWAEANITAVEHAREAAAAHGS